MKIKILAKNSEKDWREFVSHHKDSSIYHTLEWKEIIERTYGYRTSYLIAENNDNEVQGVLPLFCVESFIFGNRMVSLPYSHSVGILAKTNEALREIIDEASEITRNKNYKYLELREQKNIRIGLTKNEYYFNSVLKLNKPIEGLWKGFEKKSVRWGIKKAERNCVVVKEEDSLESYKKFYNLLLETRKSQEVPPYSFKLFKLIYEILQQKNMAKLYLAYHKEVCIAGIIIFYYNNKSIYMYSASKKKKEYLSMNPTSLIIWEAIKWSHKNGFESFDFGSTSPTHENLLRFKSNWGTENYKLPYYYFLNKLDAPPIFDPTSPKFKLFSNIWKHVPIPVARIVGPYLLKHVG